MMPPHIATRVAQHVSRLRRQRQAGRPRRAAVFAPVGSVWGKAVGSGLEEAGYGLCWVNRNGWEWSPKDDEIGLAVFSTMRGNQGRIQGEYRERGLPCIATDMPHLRGSHGQWRVHPCDHAWVPRAANSERLARLSVEIGDPKCNEGGHIVILGQAPGDSAHGMTRDELAEWAARVVATCREQMPAAEIVWRPHPGAVWSVPEADREVDPRREGLLRTLEGASAVCTYNSTAGLEALIAGYPVVAWGPACYSSLSGSPTRLAGAVSASRDELVFLLSRLANTQWSFDEIRTGQPFFFLLSEMQEAA